jgi:single-strand DNA-binding protein
MPQGINKVIVIGMIGQDPEMKYTLAGKAVANFNPAVDEE